MTTHKHGLLSGMKCQTIVVHSVLVMTACAFVRASDGRETDKIRRSPIIGFLRRHRLSFRPYTCTVCQTKLSVVFESSVHTERALPCHDTVENVPNYGADNGPV